jgi:rhodanese-related sulfurtransferase
LLSKGSLSGEWFGFLEIPKFTARFGLRLTTLGENLRRIPNHRTFIVPFLLPGAMAAIGLVVMSKKLLLFIIGSVLSVLFRGQECFAEPGNHERTSVFDFTAMAVLRPAPDGLQGQSPGSGETPGRHKIPDGWIARKMKKRDPALMVSVEDVLPGSKAKSERILVDVRPRHEFEKTRIPGSINIDLFAIKTKTFIKGQPIVLVAEGYRYRQLEEETRRLRRSGFMVTILDGGLTKWGQTKGHIEGDAFAQRELNRVPPQVFFEERDYDHWVVMDATTAPLQGSGRLIPGSVPLASSTDGKELGRQMKAVIARNKIGPFPLFLIFDECGESYERIERLVLSSGIPDVYFLQGGINGYRSFLEQQASLLDSEDKPVKRVGRCPTCP